MGAADLRNAFNAVSQPAAVCSVALLDYFRAEGREVTYLTFSGTTADGASFSIRSEPLPREADVILAARKTAERLLKQGVPL